MDEIKQPGFWKRNSVYFVGAFLAYLGAFGINFIDGGSGLEARMAWGLVWGTFMWPFFLVPQVLIQWIISKLLPRRFGALSLKRLLIVNFPIALIVAGLLLKEYTAVSPKSSFERMITKPIPASVRIVQQGGFVAMDGFFWVLRFQISHSDLKKLMDDEGFVPTSETENLWLWNERIRSNSKIYVNISEAWRAYVLKEKAAKKYIFVNTNGSDVVFVLDSH
jgi:hypothetical protein